MNEGSMSIPYESTSYSKSRIFRACLIWGLAALFYFYDNLLQVSPSAMKPELSLAFAKEAEQFGSLSAYCLYAYGLMQIPAGLLMDRFGPRRLITVASILCASGSLLFGIATSLWEAKFGRILIGVGASFAFVSCLKIAGIWFSSRRFALMIGLTATIGFLGSVFGLSTVSKIVETLGWRSSMLWGGYVGLLLSLLLWVVIKDKRSEVVLHDIPLKQQSSKEVLYGLIQIFKHKQTWIAALYAGLMFVPTLAFGGLWGIPFLVEAHGFDRNTAGYCISLIYIGWVFGSPLWGCFSDYLGKRNLPMLIANIFTLVICLGIIYSGHLSLQILGVLLFSLGFFSSGFILAFAVVRDSNPPENSGTAIGFTNALNTFWGAIAQPIIGIILDMSTWSSVGVHGERVFTLAQYQHAFLALPICLVISLCLLFFLKENFPRPTKLIV